jgi:hypothetical protein
MKEQPEIKDILSINYCDMKGADVGGWMKREKGNKQSQ